MKSSVILYGWSQESNGLRAFKDYLSEVSLCFYASEILEDLGHYDFREFEEALERACAVLDTAQIPIRDHIRSTFRGKGDQIYGDWKLSMLALYLLKINGNPKNEQVAAYQLKVHALLNQKINQPI